MCCPTARPPPSPRGCASIPAPRSSAATGRPPTPKRSARAHPTRCRSATAGTCGTAWAVRWRRPSSPTARCWRAAAAAAAARTGRAIDERTRARHAAVHELLDQGVGLLECARRLGWALNTVKRYARAATAEQLQRPPRYGRTLVDPYRDHLRRRLAAEPGVPVTRLLAEIRELGYTGSANLLVRYLNQGRAQAERAVPPPRRLVVVDHDPTRRAARTRPRATSTSCWPPARPSPSSPSTSAPSPTCSPPAAAPTSRTG